MKRRPEHNDQSDRERKIIGIFQDHLSSSYPDHNFETDSRPFRCGEEKLLFSTDEFSAEDQFRDHDPLVLGWNVAAATLSDILAAGGKPLFFGHSVTVQQSWEDRFIEQFTKGIAHCLDAAGVDFLGGDIGVADRWSYTGIALGKQVAELSRRGAEEGDEIFMTGQAGAGNLEAALKLYSEKRSLKTLVNKVTIRFPLRIKESEIIQKYARCCIDTSDGILRALLDISDINRKGFLVSNIPYRRDGLAACKLLGKPRELLFLGECGEYELLFTVPKEKVNEMDADAHAAGVSFSKIGIISPEGTRILRGRRDMLDLDGYSLYARNFRDTREYIQRLVEFVEHGKTHT